MNSHHNHTTTTRIGRVRLWNYGFFATLLALIAMLMLGLDSALHFLWHWKLLAIFYSPFIVCRFRDLGHSGWFALVALIPLIGIGALFVLLLLPGQSGTNRYGEEPTKNSTTEERIAIWMPIVTIALIGGAILWFLSVFEMTKLF